MKEEFDNFIRTKLDSLDHIEGIAFDEEAVWNKVNSKLSNINSGLYIVLTIAVLFLIGVICVVVFRFQEPVKNVKETVHPIETKEEGVSIDTIGNLDTIPRDDIKEVLKMKSTPAINKTIDQEHKKMDSASNLLTEVPQKGIDTSNTHKSLTVSDQNSILHTRDVPLIMENRAYIHVYRPGKISGALNYFTVKANGKKIGTISNGEYEVFRVPAGPTTFEIKRKKITMQLEARKHYYLRTELIFLGKTKFEQVSAADAKKEWGSKKKKIK